MKRFLIYITAVLLPILAFLCIGEVLVRQVPNSYRDKEEWMELHHNEVETLIFGGSHGFFDIKPGTLSSQFGKAYSLANVSQRISCDYFLWSKFDCPNLKTVIFSLSYPTLFFEDVEHELKEKRLIYYNLYMGYPSEPFWANFECVNMSVFSRKLRKYFFPSDKPECDNYGWGIGYTPENRKPNILYSKEAANRHTYKDLEKALIRAKKNYALLQDIAKECERRNIQLILVTTPTWHTYYNALDKRQLSKMYELIAQFQEQHSKVIYLNYLEDPRFGKEDFFDTDHLVDTGAEKFTKILSHDILANQ